MNSIGKSIMCLLVLTSLSIAKVLPDTLLPADLGPPLDSRLTKIDYFLALPHCILPLTPLERAEAIKSPWYRNTGKCFEGRITIENHLDILQLWRSIEVTVIAFTSDYMPILLVRKTSKYAGMIERFHTEQFLLRREKSEWIIDDADRSKQAEEAQKAATSNDDKPSK